MTRTLADVVDQAATEGWHIRPPTLTPRPITLDGEVVGFFCPHPAGRGRTRVGPIYVLPVYRGRRLAEQAYAELACPLVAFTHTTNVASARLHERCGFTVWSRRGTGVYWRRA